MPHDLLNAIETKRRGRHVPKPGRSGGGTPGKSSVIRRVRTSAGEQRYKQRIGSIIIGDTKLTAMFTHGSTYPGWDRIERVNIGKGGMVNPKKPLTGDMYDLGYDGEKGKWVAYHADTYDEAFSADNEDDLFRGLNAQWSGTHQEGGPKGYGSTSSGYSRPPMQTRAALGDEYAGTYNELLDNYESTPEVERLKEILDSYDTTSEGQGFQGYTNPKTGDGLTEPEMVVALQDFIGSTKPVAEEGDTGRTTHNIAQEMIGSTYSHSPKLPKNEQRLQAIAKEARDAKETELSTPTPIKLKEVSTGMWIREVGGDGTWYRVRRVSEHSSARRSFDVDQGKGTPVDRRVLSQMTTRDKLETIGTPPKKNETSTTPTAKPEVVETAPEPAAEDRLERQRRLSEAAGAASGQRAAERFNAEPTEELSDFREIEDEDEAADMARAVAAQLGMEESPGQWDDWELWTAPDGTRYDYGYDEESGKWYSTYEGDWDRVVSESDNWWDAFHGLLSHVAGDAGVPGSTPDEADAEPEKPKLTRFEMQHPVQRDTAKPVDRFSHEVYGVAPGEGLPVSERMAAQRAFGNGVPQYENLTYLDNMFRTGDGTAILRQWPKVDKDLEQAGIGPDQFPRAGLRAFVEAHVRERGAAAPAVTVDNLEASAAAFDSATILSPTAQRERDLKRELEKMQRDLAELQRRRKARGTAGGLTSPRENALKRRISDVQGELSDIRNPPRGSNVFEPMPTPAAGVTMSAPVFNAGDEIEIAAQTAGGTYPTWRVIEVRPNGQVLAETTTPDGGTSRKLLDAGRYKKKGTLPKAEAGEGTGAPSTGMDALGAPSVYPMGASTITAPTKVSDLNAGDVIVFGQFMGSKQPKYRRISKVKHTSRNTYVWFEGDSEDLSPMTQAPDQEVSRVVVGPDEMQGLTTSPATEIAPTFVASTPPNHSGTPPIIGVPMSYGRARTHPDEYRAARDRAVTLGTDIALRNLRYYNSGTITPAEFEETMRREESYQRGERLPFNYTGERPRPDLPPKDVDRPAVELKPAVQALKKPVPGETDEERIERENTYALAVHVEEARHLYNLDRADAQAAAEYAASLETMVHNARGKRQSLPKLVGRAVSLESDDNQTLARWGIARSVNELVERGETNPDVYIAAIRDAAKRNHGLDAGRNIGDVTYYDQLHHNTVNAVSGLDMVRVDSPSYLWNYIPPDDHRDVAPRHLGMPNETILRSSVTPQKRKSRPVVMVDDEDYTRHGLPRDQERERGSGTRARRAKGGKGQKLTTYEYAAMGSVAQQGEIGALEQTLGSSTRRDNLLRRGFIEQTTPGRFRLTDAGRKALAKREREEDKKRRKPGVFAPDGEVVPGTDNPAGYINDRAKEMFPGDTDTQLYLQRVAARVKSGEWTLAQARETILARAQRTENAGLSDLSEELALILALLRTGRGAKSDRVDNLITKALAADNARMTVEEAKNTGAMIALLPSGNDADELAIEGGEEPNELHVTMMYLGKADRYDSYTRSQIISSVRNSCIGVNVIEANAFSVSIFNPRGKEPCVVLGVGGKGLDQIRNTIKTNLMEDTLVGPPPEAHEPWVPHITLAYTDEPKALIDEAEERTGTVKFDRVGIYFADSITYIKLGTYQQPDLEHRLDLLMHQKDAYSARNHGDPRHPVETRGSIRDRRMRVAARDSGIASVGSSERDESVGQVKPQRERIGSAKPALRARDRAVRVAVNRTRPVEKEMLSAIELKAPTITPGGRVGDDSSHDYSRRRNWVDRRGGLPRYIRIVRNALVRKGHSESTATAIAIATMKKWASGRGNVSAKVRAAAAKAVAQWEAMKATKDASIVSAVK